MEHSVVLVRPASRGEPSAGRVVFIVAINNLTQHPVDFRVADISASQTDADGTPVALQVISYEQLVSEERSRELREAIAVSLSAAGNSLSAAHAEYGTATGSVYTASGPATFTTTYYNPAAAAAAQANANMQNDAMIASAVETGQRNMETLERFVLKDNTIMPGEWVGGQVHISPPSTMNGQSKNYVISVSFAGDVHQIEVVQQRGQ
jgi:hypothetical protein